MRARSSRRGGDGSAHSDHGWRHRDAGDHGGKPDARIILLTTYDGDVDIHRGQIGERIGRTEGTVKVHLKNILQKLDAHDRTEAVTTALRRGFIQLS